MNPRAFWAIALAVAILNPAHAAHEHQASPAAATAPAKLIPGLGDVHHPVSTQNKQAQEFFDQGMKLIFGFNHEEARRSFQQAAKLDPNLAMAWWGVAITL